MQPLYNHLQLLQYFDFEHLPFLNLTKISWSAAAALWSPFPRNGYINWYYAGNNYATFGLISRKINKLLCTSWSWSWSWSLSVFHFDISIFRSGCWLQFAPKSQKENSWPFVCAVWVCRHPSPTGCWLDRRVQWVSSVTFAGDSAESQKSTRNQLLRARRGPISVSFAISLSFQGKCREEAEKIGGEVGENQEEKTLHIWGNQSLDAIIGPH